MNILKNRFSKKLSLLVSGIKADDVNKMKNPRSSKHLMSALNIKKRSERRFSPSLLLPLPHSAVNCELTKSINIKQFLKCVCENQENSVPSIRNCKFLSAQIILAL